MLDGSRLAEPGGERALAEAFEEFRDRLRRTVRLRLDPRLKGRLDPSDILQEAFLDAARRLPEYVAEPRVPLAVWLRSLTLQRLIDLHRRHLGAKMRSAHRELSHPGDTIPEASAASMTDLLTDGARKPDSEVASRERRTLLQQSLEALEPLDREILAMRHFEQLSNSDVAQILQISVTAASNRYVRAVKRLRQVLSTFDDFQA
jgi:RNA polymerase sigma-70 factor (ECF subfamily)